MADRQDRFLDLGPGRRIHCVVAGAGPDVVFFPGNGGSVEDMHLLVPRIAERYRFVGVDGPGREPTEWPDEPFDFFADMPAVMDRALDMLGVGPHVAVGHSMGGMYALHHARRAGPRVRGVVLMEGFTTLPIHYRTAAPGAMEPARMSYEAGLKFVMRRAANLWWERRRPRFKDTFWLSQHFHDARPFVADLGVPILQFVAERGQDLPRDLDGWRRRLGMEGVRDLTVEIVPDAGHWFMLDDPDRTGDALMRFLDRIAF